MRMDRFTTLAQEALSAAQSAAIAGSHAELTPLHILAALLDDAAGITASIIAKTGVDAGRVAEIARSELSRLPKVSGAGQPQTGPAVVAVLTEAEKEARGLKDAYVSTEHLLLALAEVASPAKEVLSVTGLDRKRVLESIRALRRASGVETITDPGAESTFEALRKYTIDLNERVLRVGERVRARAGAHGRDGHVQRGRNALRSLFAFGRFTRLRNHHATGQGGRFAG